MNCPMCGLSLDNTAAPAHSCQINLGPATFALSRPNYPMRCKECGGHFDSEKHKMTCVAPHLVDCTIREHVGIEKLIQKMGMGQPLMPDPELGQDVAFLAHVIVENQKELTRLNLQVEAMRKVIEAARKLTCMGHGRDGHAELDAALGIYELDFREKQKADPIPFCKICGTQRTISEDLICHHCADKREQGS